MHRAATWIGTGLLAAAPAVCLAAGSGLIPNRDADRWSGLQGRVSLNTSSYGREGSSRFEMAVPKVQGVGLFGDYYFTRAKLSQGVSGGFRATSGVLLGATAPLWVTSALGSSGYSSVARRSLLGPSFPGEAENSTLPYVGLGYSGLSLKGGWGFAADLGVMAVQPGTSVRLGRSYNNAPGSDELVRELRLSPVLQLGVSYTF